MFYHLTCAKFALWIDYMWLMHTTGYPPLYTPPIRSKLSQAQPDILVGGHPHVLKVMHDIKDLHSFTLTLVLPDAMVDITCVRCSVLK